MSRSDSSYQPTPSPRLSRHHRTDTILSLPGQSCAPQSPTRSPRHLKSEPRSQPLLKRQSTFKRRSLGKLKNRSPKPISPIVQGPATPRKPSQRTNAEKATRKTRQDFAPLGILDSQVDSQGWLNHLVGDSDHHPSPPGEVISSPASWNEEGRVHQRCPGCREAFAELARVQDRHGASLSKLRRMTEERDKIAGQLRMVREFMGSVGKKLVEGAEIPL
ncbi:hypothetical protein BDZ97DRAFT_1928820 [Flammula alnicola]|nr:hypothetical protein BDZ97DRAFT_1928820 [Flammula alnicola]